MKILKPFLIAMAFALFSFSACGTKPGFIPYHLEGIENETATVIFDGVDNYVGVRLIDCDGVTLPEPKDGTIWSPVTLPAGKPLLLRVYVFWYNDGKESGFRRRGVFGCPPLEAGKKYKLLYSPARTGKDNGFGSLILTDISVKNSSTNKGEQIHIQVIPPLDQKKK